MNIAEILEQATYPRDILVIDFESYFDQEYSLKKMSNVEYVADPRFEFTGLGIKIDNTDTVFIPGPRVKWAVERLKKRFGKGLHNVTVVVKNNKFDCLILAEKFDLYPPYVIDVEDLSRYYDARMKHGLAALSKMYKLPAKGETVQFKGQHWEDMDQEAMKEYCINDVDREYDLFQILLPLIDNPETEFKLMQHTLNLYLRPPFVLNTGMAQEIADGMEAALHEDLAGVENLVLQYATKKKTTVPEIIRAKSIFPEILADVLPEDEEVPMKKGKRDMIPALAVNDVAFQLLLAHSDEQVRNLCKAKAACTSWPLHQAKVKSMIAQARCSGGKMRIPLKYYGAHTGRWSGTQKWNPLNLGGKGRGKAIHPLIGKVRHTLEAPPGHTLLICDSAQIEARELAWISGQNDLVEDFATGGDPYSRLATKVFGEEVRKPKEDDDPETSALLTIRRGFGKDAVLGCGYGLGSNTFFLRCRQNETLRPLFDSGEYDRDFINGLIKTYRSTYSQIPKFWDKIEKCFRWVTKYPNEVMTYYIPDDNLCLHEGMEKQKPLMKNAILTFWREGTTTIIQLPSGRRLFYRHATVIKGKELKYIWGPLWGGTLTENVIQAICRDLLAGWLLECERQRIQIILHLYDELVACVPEHQAEEKLIRMKKIMTTNPSWSQGLPLAVEGEISSRYKK